MAIERSRGKIELTGEHAKSFAYKMKYPDREVMRKRDAYLSYIKDTLDIIEKDNGSVILKKKNNRRSFEHYMRDRNRIKPFLTKLEELWNEFPDYRFGQLIYLIGEGFDKSIDIALPEEEEWLQALQKVLDKKKL